MRFLSGIQALLVAAPPVVFAGVARAAEPGGLGLGDETMNLAGALVKVVVALVVVVGLLAAVAALLQRSRFGQGAGRPGTRIRLVESKMIAPKKYVALVEVAGESLALGVTDQNITLLSRLGPAAGVAAGEEPARGFRAVLTRARAKDHDGEAGHGA